MHLYSNSVSHYEHDGIAEWISVLRKHLFLETTLIKCSPGREMDLNLPSSAPVIETIFLPFIKSRGQILRPSQAGAFLVTIHAASLRRGNFWQHVTVTDGNIIKT